MHTQAISQPVTTNIGRAAIGLFVALSSIYLLLARGGVTSIDEWHVYGTAASLAERGSWRMELEDVRRPYSRFSVVPSLLGVPLYHLALPIAESFGPDLADEPDRLTRRDILMAAVSLQTPFITAATAAILFIGLCRLGFQSSAALATALTFGLGTLAFAYSGSLYVQPLGAFTLAAVVLSAAIGSPILLGVSLAFLLSVRLDLGAILPAVVLHTVRFNRRPIGTLVLLAAGTIAGLAWHILVNVLRLDHWLLGDYGSEAFSTPVWLGLWSVLFSSGKGLIWFAPAAALGFVLLPTLARERPTVGLLAITTTATGLLMVACWWTWHGGWSWGPRLLVPFMPVLVLPLAWFFEQWPHQHVVTRWLAIVVVMSSICVQLSGVLGDPLRDRSFVGALVSNENESIYIPQVGPWSYSGSGVHILAVRLWRQLPQTRLVLTLLYATLATLSVAMTWWSLRQIGVTGRDVRSIVPTIGPRPLFAVSICLAMVAAPTVVQWWLTELASGAAAGPEPISPQLRPFRPAKDRPGRWSGQVYAPLSGDYTFYQRGSVARQVYLDGRPVFAGPGSSVQVGYMPLPAGYHRMEVEGGGRDSMLFWTTPGNAHYKELVPDLYLAGPPPSTAHEWAIKIAHWKWAVWIAAIVLSVYFGSHAAERAHPRRATLPQSPK